MVADEFNFFVVIGGKTVEADHRRLAEFMDILDVFVEIGQAFLESFRIFFSQFAFVNTPIASERLTSGHQYHGGSVESCALTFDVKKLFRSQVESEPGFGNDPIRQTQSHLGGDY